MDEDEIALISRGSSPKPVDSNDQTFLPPNPELDRPPSPFGKFPSYAAYRRNARRIRSERRQVVYMKNLVIFLFISWVCFCLLAGLVAFYFATKGPQGNDTIISGETVMIAGFLLVIPMGGCAINACEQFGKLRKEWRKGLNGYREEW
ncbi:hypothetical protein RUND412_005124 [Rhizina undulata]